MYLRQLHNYAYASEHAAPCCLSLKPGASQPSAKVVHDMLPGDDQMSSDLLSLGNGTYQVRCMPDRVGEWRYETHSDIAELNGKTGTFSCNKPSEKNHGPVRVAHTFHFAYDAANRLVGTRFPDGDVFSGHPIRLGETPGRWWRAGPAMGQDTVEVLTKRAGLSTDDVDGRAYIGRVVIRSVPTGGEARQCQPLTHYPPMPAA